MTFDRAVIGLLAFCTLVLMVVAYKFPPPSVTFSPKAELAFSGGDLEPAAGPGMAALPGRGRAASGLRVIHLSRKFSSLNYRFERIPARGGLVPRLFVAALPVDMPQIRVPEKRKAIFLKVVLPLILKINEEVKRDRQRLRRLLDIKQRKLAIQAPDRLWLVALAERYGAKRGDLAELMRRTDNIPPSLALAQAAEESGWGTSRFAIEGNALFGQWTFGRSRKLVPRKRDNGRSHGVKSFASLLDAVRAYLHNLNTHRAYRGFREARQKMRRGGRSLDSMVLAGSLTSYSVRGKKYVRSLRTIIGANELLGLDKTRLGGAPVQLLAKPAI
ncbi:MAG: glucosaminidase domain-containing protein [Rhodospirillales bacterium]|jgi:Bax protein|nr:glucosaminidase domain-containing protein [Rhodospirillales bacterium]